jgi:hypothetical protein
VDLDAAAEELYGGLPEEFVARRQQLVAEARAARDRPLAAAIGQFRRPTKSAWLVNQLSREATAEIAALFDLGDALRQAQVDRDGPALRHLSQQRQAAVADLVRRAAEFAERHGEPITEAQRQEVTQTLQAALADPSTADLVRQGRLVQPIAYGGFGVWALGEAGEAAPAREAPTKAKTETVTKEAGPAPEEVAAARESWLAARRAVKERTAQVEQARQRRDEVAQDVADLQARLAAAEAERAEAEQVVERLEADLDAARAEAEERAAAYAELAGEEA